MPKNMGYFFTPKFLLFFTPSFLHTNFCFFTPKILFFYTKNFVFLHQNFCFSAPKILPFLDQFFQVLLDPVCYQHAKGRRWRTAVVARIGFYFLGNIFEENLRGMEAEPVSFFYTNIFLHQKFCFLHQFFLHQILKFRKRRFWKKLV